MKLPLAVLGGIAIAGWCFAPSPGSCADAAAFRNLVSGEGDTLPRRYVPPMISNGSLCMLVDYDGCQSQRAYAKMTPGIFWEGRRYGPPNDLLVPFGHFEQELSIDGRPCGAPTRWTQSLDTRDALVETQCHYADGITVETVVFTPLDEDLIVIRKRLSASRPPDAPIRITFKYQLSAAGEPRRAPRRMTTKAAWDAGERSVDIRYELDGSRASQGIVSVFSDAEATANCEGQAIALGANIVLQPDNPADLTFYLSFSDSLDRPDFEKHAADRRNRVRREGYADLLKAHRARWRAYWDESHVRIPDPALEKAYQTAQYHLRANSTKWSFPVGIFNTHWAGRFFGWDEMFCHQALVTSNHREIARRCPEFRFAGLEKAVRRASHYGRPGKYGARFPWETLEDGTEGSPPGYWMEHVFHMSHIALAAWNQFLYADDTAYLDKTGYPIIRECARFFVAYMIYETPDGGAFVGKCTDLERLGPAKQNPFMTSCGIICTLEAAARAATALGLDADEKTQWVTSAKKLRQSLPHDGGRYVPYPGCKELSIASLGGLFPYPIFDGSEEMQRNAAYHFVKHGRASGNMYPVGNSVCAWYAGWMAAALAALGDKEEPVRLLAEAASGAGCFGELFEINEEKVSMRPWFSTASGNFIYAMNQMLLQCRDEEIRIAAGAPEAWRDYEFKLACHGDLVADAAISGGRLVKLDLVPGGSREVKRRLVVPERLMRGADLPEGITIADRTTDGNRIIDIAFTGRCHVIKNPR